MRGNNGYFQLRQKDDDVFIQIFAPKQGGKKVSLEQMALYLERNQILTYDSVLLKKAIDRGMDTEVFLLTYRLLPTNEEMYLKVADDKMSAIVQFFPPYADGHLLTKDDILNSLAQGGVREGICDEIIDRFLTERFYCTEYIFALGTEPVQGKDAVITYYFNTEVDCKPTMNEDGTVDFFHLNNINHISKGDVLARLTPEIEGKAGVTVEGVPIVPFQVKHDKLRYGRHIEISEDKLTLISEVNGHVELVDDKVFVSDTYTVAGDVDVSTGNIEYEGNIEVSGNVLAGFSLKADGDIVVDGVVEGATLIAGRDIVLHRGIIGMGKGYLEAGGDVLVKYIENARVKSEGSITTESILHSHVTAKEKVVISGRKGFVTGGSVEATLLVEAKTIGSEMGAETVISVGSDPDKKENFRDLQRDVGSLSLKLQQLKPMAVKASKLLQAGTNMTYAERENLLKILRVYHENTEKLEKDTSRMQALKGFIDNNNDARVRVEDRIFPGVKINISECRYHVKDVMHHCQFRMEGGEVRSVGL